MNPARLWNCRAPFKVLPKPFSGANLFLDGRLQDYRVPNTCRERKRCCGVIALSAAFAANTQQPHWEREQQPQQQQQQQKLDVAPAIATLPALTIKPGEVHIWWLDPRKVPASSAVHHCASLLTSEEIAEYTSAPASQQLPHERMLARALMRSVLARYLGQRVHPNRLRFVRNAHGKPDLLWPNATREGHRLCFNITHTPSMIGLAVTAGTLVGLDVEACSRRTRGDLLRLARRRFSPAEVADLEACADVATRAMHFLQLWTLKEAYVKALGRGLSAMPSTRSFSFRVHGLAAPAGQAQEPQTPPGLREQSAMVSSSSGGSSNSSTASYNSGDSGKSSASSHGSGDSSSSSSSSSSNRITAGASTATRGSNSRTCDSSGGMTRGDSVLTCSDDCNKPVISFDTLVVEERSRRWQFQLLQPNDDHIAALCVEAVHTTGADTSLSRNVCSNSSLANVQVSMLQALPWEQELPVTVNIIAQGSA